MKKIILFFFSLIYLTYNLSAQEGLVGYWTFDNQTNPCNATIGNNLVLVGSHTGVAGPDSSNGAMNIGVGSYYEVQHNIAPNGGGSRVNEFTIIMDIKLSEVGQWYTLYQINPLNTDDGEWFIDVSGKMGVHATGYSDPLIEADTWYRLAIAVKNDSRYDYYINGRLVLNGLPNGVDERFSLGPSILLFADENMEDNPIDVAEIKIFSRALSDKEIEALGGFTNTNNVNPFLFVEYGVDQEIIISVDPETHINYGFAYPVTYKIGIPSGSSNLSAIRRFSNTQEWTTITEKHSNNFFNGIEAVRFDYSTSTAFVSAAFSSEEDFLFIKIVNEENRSIPISYQEICTYYDDRDATVTSSADDWADSGDEAWYQSDEAFQITCRQFRKYHLWLSCGIITQNCDSTTWQHIQTQLDSGYVEACSHSRTHPSGPYENPRSQIAGSKQDLIDNLDMPDLFRKGAKEYVYTWIAPANYYDEIVNTLVGAEQYLVNRRYNESFDRFADWNYQAGYYHTIGISREASPIWKGITDLDALNSYFDLVVAKHGIYHVMTHPYFLLENGFEAAGYTWDHLEYISNKKNLWYASLGHLYLYHYLQENSPTIVSVPKMEKKIVKKFMLSQNYPNPFNPTTEISYSIPESGFVQLDVYDVLGSVVANLVDKEQTKGNYKIVFNASSLTSGIYFYRLQIGAFAGNATFTETKKLILLK